MRTGVAGGRRHRVQYRLEKRLHIHPWHVRVRGGAALAGRGVQHRIIQLVIPRNHVQEEVLDHRDHLSHAGLRAVDLVDDDNWSNVLLEGLAQHVGSLGHGAVNGVHQQQAAIGHIHDTFHLAAEVGVARRVDNVDPDTAIGNRGVLGQDRNAALSFQRVGVHNQSAHLLVVPKDLALFQQSVDQSGLAVVDVGNDGQVANGVVLAVSQIYSPHILRNTMITGRWTNCWIFVPIFKIQSETDKDSLG